MSIPTLVGRSVGKSRLDSCSCRLPVTTFILPRLYNLSRCRVADHDDQALEKLEQKEEEEGNGCGVADYEDQALKKLEQRRILEILSQSSFGKV